MTIMLTLTFDAASLQVLYCFFYFCALSLSFALYPIGVYKAFNKIQKV